LKNLKEHTLKSKIVFQGKFLDVRCDEVALPNGRRSTREWINHPGASVIIPILPDQRIALVRQFRYPLKEEFMELPAGKRNKDENYENCALRELEEETGYAAGKLTFLTEIAPAIGFANEIMKIYLAQDLKKTKKDPDSDEFVELVPTTLSEAVSMVWDRSIIDVKTIIGVLWIDKNKNLIEF
tara:strand:- start:313 stop:861 length:549 start_codon:yes stop_codon:yes gene_type:complete